jgi:hypothetical protein
MAILWERHYKGQLLAICAAVDTITLKNREQARSYRALVPSTARLVMNNESAQSPPQLMGDAINKALIITMPGARTLALAMVMAIAATVTPAQARTSILTRGVPVAVAQQRDIGASAAAAAASSASGGQVLGVKRRSSGQGVIYIVNVLLPGGRVRSMTVDGQSGQVR